MLSLRWVEVRGGAESQVGGGKRRQVGVLLVDADFFHLWNQNLQQPHYGL